MQGDVADGRSAAARARDLQPLGRPGKCDLGAPVSEGDLCGSGAPHGPLDRRLQENLGRRMKDAQMLGVLAEDGFEGPRYDRFVDELVRYSVSVLRGWLRSGFIFQLVADRGFGLNPHESDLEEVAANGDLREELAMMTVARALPRFRQRALIEGGWTCEGGASITTYFMGACLYHFPNEFRRYRADAERQRRAVQRQQVAYEAPVSPFSAADVVLGGLRVLDDLKDIADPRTRAAVALTIDGYSQEEIRQLLGAQSVRAIEGMLYRWRRKAKEDEGGGRHGQPG
ncbi:hypothetical protein ACWGDT_27315 [Streptomyces avermitilis]